MQKLLTKKRFDMTKKEKAIKIIEGLKKLFPITKIALNYNSDFNLLVAVILSAQTTDKKVNEVAHSFFEKMKSARDYAKLSQIEFEQYIKSIGLYKGKAKNILATAKIIEDEFGGKIPKTIGELVKLPGVGRKTANVVVSIIYNINEGIAVDTHVKRLSQLWGLSQYSNPDKIEKDLMELIPKNEWRDFTLRTIDYGRKHCPANCKHNNCPLRNLTSK